MKKLLKSFVCFGLILRGKNRLFQAINFKVMFFSLNRQVTKSQICTKYQMSVLVVISIQKEKRIDSMASPLLELKQQQKRWLTFAV